MCKDIKKNIKSIQTYEEMYEKGWGNRIVIRRRDEKKRRRQWKR